MMMSAMEKRDILYPDSDSDHCPLHSRIELDKLGLCQVCENPISEKPGRMWTIIRQLSIIVLRFLIFILRFTPLLIIFLLFTFFILSFIA
jgi:hypothetical protein